MLLAKVTLMDIILTLISGILCVLIAIYAYKSYMIIKEKTLLYINLTFSLVSTGLFVEVIMLAMVIMGKFISLVVIGEYVSVWSQIIGYAILVYAYYKFSLEQKGIIGFIALTLAPHMLLWYSILIVVVTFIVVKLLINYLINRSRSSALTLVSFIILEISYILLLISLYNLRLYFLAELLRLLAFCMLAIMLYTLKPEVKIT